MISPASLSQDLCMSCNICTVNCPVFAVSNKFLGPKVLGPQATRLSRTLVAEHLESNALCTACGICSTACPHSVPVSEKILENKSLISKRSREAIRDRFLSRPDLVGKAAGHFKSLYNAMMGSEHTRGVLQNLIGLNQTFPFPRITSSRMSRASEKFPSESRAISPRQQVVFLDTCGTAYYEGVIKEISIQVLDALGFEVILSEPLCCGLPLHTNGYRDQLIERALSNTSQLRPFADQKLPIIGTSPSCVHMIRHTYSVLPDQHSLAIATVAGQCFDLFEFLSLNAREILNSFPFRPLDLVVLYHPPCQLKSMGIGLPAVKILDRIPDLQIILSENDCCGSGGTYAMKVENRLVSERIRESISTQLENSQAEVVACDSETCRWWISGAAEVPTVHPVQILAEAMGIQ